MKQEKAYRVFRSCSALISKCDIQTALYVLPYVVLHVLQDGSQQDIEEVKIWATTWQNQQNECAPSEKRRSAWASAQSDQSSLSAWRKLGSLATHWVHSEDWSDWVDAQADLSLRWVHSHFVGFVMRRLIYCKILIIETLKKMLLLS